MITIYLEVWQFIVIDIILIFFFLFFYWLGYQAGDERLWE